MSLQPVRTLSFDGDSHLLSQCAQIHYDCITQDHTMVTFMPPLDLTKMTRDWEAFAMEAKAGRRIFFVQSVIHPDGAEEVAGIVTLKLRESETGPFRSDVSRLLVSPKHRYKGIARNLMQRLEQTAKEIGRWLVMLDTTIGSGAELVYPKLGYKEVGRIPDYGFSPKDGKLREEIFFYKDLRDPGVIPQVSIM